MLKPKVKDTIFYTVFCLAAASIVLGANVATALTLPRAPDSVEPVVTAGVNVSLTWRDRSRNERGFYIELREARGRGSLPLRRVRVPANTTGWSFTAPRSGTYLVRLRSYNRAGSSRFTPKRTIQIVAAEDEPSLSDTPTAEPPPPPSEEIPPGVESPVPPTNSSPFGETPTPQPTPSPTSPPAETPTPTATPLPTSTPTPISTPSLATRAIGNYDLIPGLVFSGVLKAGVVAFHETGVTVSFQVNSAPPVNVTAPTWNDQTGVWEYVIELDAEDFTDGPLSLQATITPNGDGHLARILAPITLYANGSGTFTNASTVYADCNAGSDTSGNGSFALPYRTIDKAHAAVGVGGTVYLKAGTCYDIHNQNSYPANYSRWTTITTAPGVTRDQVRIRGGRFSENYVHWKNVSLFSDSPTYSNILYIESSHKIWVDGCDISHAMGRYVSVDPFANANGRLYITDSVIHDVMNSGGWFLRNVDINTVGSDIFRASNNLTSINVTVVGVDPGSSGAHPDFIQFYNPGVTVENITMYNTEIYDMNAQGFFGAEGWGKDIAIVNMIMEKDPPSSFLISQTSNLEHVLLWHYTSVDIGWVHNTPASESSWDVRNNVFAHFSAAAVTSLPDSLITHNHFTSLSWNQPLPMGDNTTLGDPQFVDVAADDYRLGAMSPARASGTWIPGVPADVRGNPFGLSRNRGALAD